MTILVVTMLAMWLAMRVAPETPVGRALHAWLVVRPAARLLQVRRGHVALVMLVAGIVGTLAWLGGDAVRMASMAAPELATWATSFEIAACLDVAITAVTAWVAARNSGLGRVVGAWRRILPRQGVRVRAPRTRRRVDAANDDDGDGRGWARAA